MRGLPLWRSHELLDFRPAQVLEMLILQKAGMAERIDQVLFQFAYLNFAGGAYQAGAQIELSLSSIEASQAGYQRRGYQ